mmetsp:Transcript_27565/g.66333  ORF Transcript_27565/g.66333 Transcript_27565/m.66333 type:complete len:380 (+) Transcript_27565:80-1219(+)
MDKNEHQYPNLSVIEDQVCICGWQTDTLLINQGQRHSTDDDDVSSRRNQRNSSAHTLIIFIPGNPGVIHWYTDLLAQIINHLGNGFAARGVSYAGHGVGDDVVGTNADHNQSFHSEHLANEINVNAQQKNMRIPWTMDGQIEHKIEYVDKVLEDWRQESTSSTPNLVFISHSIGAYFVQCLLLRRPDILAKTSHVIHLMPFFRFDPPPLKKLLLSSTAHSYKYTIPTMTMLVGALSSIFPRDWIGLYLDKVLGVKCPKGRAISLDILAHPNMVKNHLVLGFQEIRELPEFPNDVALRLINLPHSILFCGNDMWAPEFHMRDLHCMKRHTEIPNNIHLEYLKLRHDFVVRPDQIQHVVRLCVQRVKSGGAVPSQDPRSRL